MLWSALDRELGQIASPAGAERGQPSNPLGCPPPVPLVGARSMPGYPSLDEKRPFATLSTKRDKNPPKKHGNIPL